MNSSRAFHSLCLTSAFLLSAACTEHAPSDTAAAVDEVARGEYLVNIGGCHDCHTPKVFTDKGMELDTSRLLSGHPSSEVLPPVPVGAIGPTQWGGITNNHLTAWVGPWGTSFAANLTPDASGLASWTPETFVQALRTGKHLGVGRPILPPMPWPGIAKMTDKDLLALFAYLKSLPPVANTVPEPIPPAAPAATSG